MSLSPPASPVPSPGLDVANTDKASAIRPETVPVAASHAIEMFDSDHSSTGSPAIAPLVLPSKPPTVSPMTTLSLETAKEKTSATAVSAPAPANATHQKGQTGMNGGRWTEQEHQSFLAGLRLYGREWKKVAAKIKTRTSAQIRSHAQKYFAKLARDDEMRKQSGLPFVAPAAPALGYFSDGGSSIAQNSGDDDVEGQDISRLLGMGRQTKGHSAILIAPMGSAINGLYKSAAANKKRSRSAATGFDQLTSSGYPLKQPKRSANDAPRVEILPSQEELLAKASPNLRHRLAGLIEAELCALQVLSCYALLQQHDQASATHQKPKRQGRPRKMSTATANTTGSVSKASSIALSMLSTEQIPSTSSIY